MIGRRNNDQVAYKCKGKGAGGLRFRKNSEVNDLMRLANQR